jgi:hypothetical protein
LSVAYAYEARAGGFVVDPRCTRFSAPVICTCYLQNGGYISYRLGRLRVFPPYYLGMMDVINNCITDAGAAPRKQ